MNEQNDIKLHKIAEVLRQERPIYYDMLAIDSETKAMPKMHYKTCFLDYTLAFPMMRCKYRT